MPASTTKMLCVVLLQSIFFIGLTSSMFADDYDPDDVPPDQARGYSYPVPANPLSLPLPVMEEFEYDDYDPNDVPADQAAPSGYLPPTEYDDYDPTDIPSDQAAPAPAGYLPARRGRKLRNRKLGMAMEKMMGHDMMVNTRRAKSGMRQRKPKAFRSSVRRFSGRKQSPATSEARRQGRQIMSVSEWLRRG